MKQKLVTKVSIISEKSRTKALKTAVSVSGVESVAFQGADKNQIVVIGEGIDSVCLITLLRKNVGHTDLVSVGPLDDKKETSQPMSQPIVWSGYPVGVPQYYVPEPHDTHSSDLSCTIM